MTGGSAASSPATDGWTFSVSTSSATCSSIPVARSCLFQIVTEREEKASIATGSNLPFSEWGSIIRDPRLVAAIVDRLTFDAHIIETGTESYRLRTTRATRSRKKAAS
jgi:hypothetical protein